MGQILNAGLASNDLAAEEWAVKSSAWLAALVILAFLIGGCCCLSNMDFQRDTLLFAATK